jgi:hypothetical protein
LFIGLAVVCVTTWSKRSFLLVGILLGLTPMVVYLGGVVNPNGPEVCVAICAWVSGLVVVLEQAESPPRGLVVIFTVSTAALALTRGLSPLWVVLILLVLGSLAGRRRALALLRMRPLQISLGIIAVSGFAAVAWIVGAHSNSLAQNGPMLPAHESALDTLFNVFGATGSWIQQMIGIFGFLDTPAPFATFLIWYVVIGFLVLLALSSTGRRGTIVLLGLLAIVIFLPVVIADHEVHRFGMVWQGRYILPMAVGIPIVSAALIDGTGAIDRFRVRISVIFCLGIGVADFAAFLTSQRRYASGLPGPIDPAHGTWGPPLGNYLMTLWSLVTTALLVGAVAFAVIRSESDETPLLPQGDGTPGEVVPRHLAGIPSGEEASVSSVGRTAGDATLLESW